MTTLNKAILIGHLGKDSEVSTTPNGKHKLSFTLATHASYKDCDGQWKKETDWHNVVAWGEHYAAKQEMLTRGKQVYVEGRIRNRKYVNRDGENRSISEVNVFRLFLLGKAPLGAPGEVAPHELVASEGDAGEDLDAPF